MKYSPERKEAVLKKMLPPHNKSIPQIAAEEGVSEPTLYLWRRKARAKGRLLPDEDTTPAGWTSRDKFAAVLETAAINEAELAEYCRQRGLYPEQIQMWRRACEQANDWEEAYARESKEEIRVLKKKQKELERENRRKEKALAEAAALLILKKNYGDLGGERGRMISTEERIHACTLIAEANHAGARLALACREVNISVRTFQRWRAHPEGDRRPHAKRAGLRDMR